jgi:hypothetical protein
VWCRKKVGHFLHTILYITVTLQSTATENSPSFSYSLRLFSRISISLLHEFCISPPWVMVWILFSFILGFKFNPFSARPLSLSYSGLPSFYYSVHLLLSPFIQDVHNFWKYFITLEKRATALCLIEALVFVLLPTALHANKQPQSVWIFMV